MQSVKTGSKSSCCSEYTAYFLHLINYMVSQWLFWVHLFCLSLYEIWTSQKMSNSLRPPKVPEVLVRIRHLPSSGSSGDSWHVLLREEQMHSNMFLKCLLAWYNIFISPYVESQLILETDIETVYKEGENCTSVLLKITWNRNHAQWFRNVSIWGQQTGYTQLKG